MQAIGRELRARRTARGRTVASVAADAGLSVPYIANLENGRGNPTIAALGQLAQALGLRVNLMLQAAGIDGNAAAPAPVVPAALVRLGRTERFRRTVRSAADGVGTDADEFGSRLVTALATVAQVLDRDITEDDWWRLLDALLLITAHPA